MRKWFTPAIVAGCALLAVPILAYGLPDEDDKEKAAAQKELKDLEAQREKIDSRIREIRKKAGLSGARAYAFGDGKHFAIPGDGEHRIIVEKAIGDAHKHVQEALKNLPKDFHKFEFDFDNLDKDGKAFRFLIDKDGKQYKYDSSMSPEEKKKFKEAMEKMNVKIFEGLKGVEGLKGMRKLEGFKGLEDMKHFKFEVPEARALKDGKIYRPKVVTPDVKVIEPRIFRGGGDEDSRALRDEIRALRDEVNKLREEVKRNRGDRTSGFETFDSI